MFYSIIIRIFILASLSLLIIQVAFASDYCVKDISADAYKSFIPKCDHKPQPPFTETLTKDLPSFFVTAKLDTNKLFFVQNDGQIYPITKLNSGDDYNGWEAIYELEDNWLYIVGAQYNHALHLYLNLQKKWVVDQIIRIEEDEGVVDNFLSLVFGWDTKQIKRDNLTSIKKINGRIIYSEALKRLFILDLMQEFRKGDFVTFSQMKAKTYIGEIVRLKTAFFKADDGQLYSYDGLKLRPVVNGRVKPFLLRMGVFEQGLLRDVPSFNRLFYTIRAGVYELIKNQDNYELKPISLHDNTGDLFFTHFIPTPDGKDIAILTRGNIFLLSTLKGIYPRSVPEKQINTTGKDELPALIHQLKGIMFTTGGAYVSGDETEYYHLLEKCSN